MHPLFCCTMYKKCKEAERSSVVVEPGEKQSVHFSEDDSLIKFKYRVLRNATKNFDKGHQLGRGGFGDVFQGVLKDGTSIAVKRLQNPGDNLKSFKSEVRTLRRAQHPNIVKLIGYCGEKNRGLIVYEYMSNGSLDKWIFDSSKRRGTLNWDDKKKIISQIAKGLLYMHQNTDLDAPIWHRDIKPENILLDELFNAKLSDFGLAKLLSKYKSSTMSQGGGTFGYMAPEIFGSGRITNKIDVYSYGIVVLEIVFEKKNFSKENEQTLAKLVKTKLEHNQLSDITSGLGINLMDEVHDIIKLAVWCLGPQPAARPSMSDVVNVLNGDASTPEIKIGYSTTSLPVGSGNRHQLDSILPSSI